MEVKTEVKVEVEKVGVEVVEVEKVEVEEVEKAEAEKADADAEVEAEATGAANEITGNRNLSAVQVYV